MGEETRVCRLCLQLINKGEPSSGLTENTQAFRNLKFICCNSTPNLELTEDPLICESCGNKLEKLAAYKIAVIANEHQLENKEKNELDAFLHSICEEVKLICRLCHTVSFGSKKTRNWKECEKWLDQCNIQVDENVPLPSKVCNKCEVSLQSMVAFRFLCDNNEKLITDLADGDEKVPTKYLASIASFNLRKKIRINDGKDKSGSKCQKIINVEEKGSSDLQPEEENLSVTKTSNTYKNRKSCSMADMPSTSKGIRNSLTDRRHILKKVDEQLKKMHISIDAAPSDLANTTLEVDNDGLVQEEAEHEYNVTQELIDVLEGRLNNTNMNYQTQELLDVLEGNGGEDLVVGAKNSKDFIVEKGTVKKSDSGVNAVEDVPAAVVEPAPVEAKSVSIGKKRGRPSKSNKDDEDKCAASVPKKRGRPPKNAQIHNAIKEEVVDESEDAAEDSNVPADELNVPRKRGRPPKNLQVKNVTAPVINENDEMPSEKASPEKEVQPKKWVVMPNRCQPKKRGRPRKDSQGVEKLLPKEEKVDEESEGANDKFVEKAPGKEEGRKCQVMVLKGNRKRRNRKEMEKTWNELTKDQEASVVEVAVLGGGMEIEVVKPRKRGRPRLPDAMKKPPKKKRGWIYCEKCPYRTYTINSLIQHQYVHNVMSSMQTLHCTYCTYTTSNAEHMQQHKQTHAIPNLHFKCIFCESAFRKKNSCMYHALRHDDKDIASQFYCLVYNGTTDEECFECFQCEYQSIEESPMPDHVIEHTIEKPPNISNVLAKYKCNLCDYRTKTEENLIRHKALHEERRNKKKYTVKQELIDDHVEANCDSQGEGEANEESEKPLLKCDKCRFLTRNKRSLINHKSLKHNRVFPPLMPGGEKAERAAAAEAAKKKQMYYCNECSYSTPRKLNMPRHALVHRTKENMEFFECTYCIFETKHRKSYTRHMERRHGIII